MSAAKPCYEVDCIIGDMQQHPTPPNLQILALLLNNETSCILKKRSMARILRKQHVEIIATIENTSTVFEVVTGSM